VASNDTDADRAQNRRVEFRMVEIYEPAVATPVALTAR
jgi:hypothetical protein